LIVQLFNYLNLVCTIDDISQLGFSVVFNMTPDLTQL